jgi:hypothetical protein
MATTTHLSNPYISIASTDFTDQCTSASLTIGFDELEKTAFGSNGRTFTKGLQAIEVTATMFLSYGATEVEAILWDELGEGNTTVVVGASSVTPSATNPVYTISNAMLSSITPVGGSVGELSTIEVTFTGGTFARAVA